MPVESVQGGYRWGKHGRIYRSRAKAEAQGRAILASGWRDDSPRGRRSRLEMQRLLMASRKAEARYRLDILGLFRGVHRGVMKLVDEEILPKRPARETRHDAPPHVVRSVLGHEFDHKLAKHIRDRAVPAFETMATAVDKKNATAYSTLIGIHVGSIPGLQAVQAKALDDNIGYLEDAGRDYADDVRDVLEDPANDGLRVEELRDLLFERAEVSESKALFLAVDQTLKLNASISAYRQQSAGLSQYVWSTSLDERVRPLHAEIEGRVFSWDDPPVTTDDGDTNHPGEDFRCRCVAIPYIDELEEGAEPELPEESDEDFESAAE